MATITLTAVTTGESMVLAGSPQEMEDPSGYYGHAFSTNADWYTIGDSKSDVQERPAADGAFGIMRDWRPGLPISVDAWCRQPDRAGVRTERRRLGRILGNGKSVIMTWTDGDEITSRALSIRSMVPDNNSGLAFRYVFDAVALDPKAYGPARSVTIGQGGSAGGLLFPLGTNPSAYWDFGADGTSNRAALTNNGTSETYPSLLVTGGEADGFTIVDTTTGQVVTLVRNIPQGSTVRINQRTGTAILDGQTDISGSFTSQGFFAIPSGDTHIIQFSPLGTITGTPTLTLTIQDADS